MDPISDMLTRIRNANMRKIKSVELPHSKVKENIAQVLKRSSYLVKVESKEKVGGKKYLNLELKYEEGEPAITDIKRISRPGQRIHSGSTDFQKFGGRRGVIVVSTSKGIMPHFKARKEKLGGEVICVVY